MYRRFQKGILLLGMIFGIIAVLGTIDCILRADFPGFSMFHNVIMTVVVIAVELSSIKIGFYIIHKANGNEKKRFAVILFFLFFLLVFFVACQGHILPIYDSYNSIDVAFGIADGLHLDKNMYHYDAVSAFGNNYFLILVFSYFIRFLRFLDIEPTMLLFYYINGLAVWLSVFLVWNLVRYLRGIDRANRVLLLCVLNPLFYYMVLWVYSGTLSMPIMLLITTIIAVIVREKGKSLILWSVLIGILTAIGIMLRPTAIFPLFVVAIMGLFKSERILPRKKTITMILLILAVTGGLSVVISSAKSRVFSDIQDNRYPITYWFMIGSNADGTVQDSWRNRKIIMETEPSRRAEVALQKTVENYSARGILGTVRLFAKKISILWSDGESNLTDIISQTDRGGGVYEYIAGSRRAIPIFFIRCFRAIMLVGTLVWIVRAFLKKENPPRFEFFLLCVLFGATVWHMFWEVAESNSISFVSFLIILSEREIESFCDSIRIRKMHFRSVGVTCIIVGVLMFVLAFGKLFRTPIEYESIIRTSGSGGERQSLGSETMTISQTFIVHDGFSEVRIPVYCGQIENASDYGVMLYSGDICRFEGNLSNMSITNQMLYISVGTMPAGEYRLVLEKKTADKPGIHFYTRNTYHLALYEGELERDGIKQASVLIMDVLGCTNEPMLPISNLLVFACFTNMILLFGVKCCVERNLKPD